MSHATAPVFSTHCVQESLGGELGVPGVSVARAVGEAAGPGRDTAQGTAAPTPSSLRTGTVTPRDALVCPLGALIVAAPLMWGRNK